MRVKAETFHKKGCENIYVVLLTQHLFHDILVWVVELPPFYLVTIIKRIIILACLYPYL